MTGTRRRSRVYHEDKGSDLAVARTLCEDVYVPIADTNFNHSFNPSPSYECREAAGRLRWGPIPASGLSRGDLRG